MLWHRQFLPISWLLTIQILQHTHLTFNVSHFDHILIILISLQNLHAFLRLFFLPNNKRGNETWWKNVFPYLIFICGDEENDAEKKEKKEKRGKWKWIEINNKAAKLLLSSKGRRYCSFHLIVTVKLAIQLIVTISWKYSTISIHFYCRY